MATSTLLAGRYQLHEELGRGAMGVVYRASDRLTGDMIALKQITLPTKELQFGSRGTNDSMGTLRLALANEFRTLSSLRHPFIISVIDYGFDDQRQPYFTMDYLVASQTILDSGMGKSIDKKVDLLLQVSQALEYLHRRSILHRDLKPDNVLVTSDYCVQVMDFGLSVNTKGASGQTAGTPAYMAPETIQAGLVSEASDLYALGIMAYQLLAGKLPFTNIREILHQEADLTELSAPPDVIAVVERLLKKDPTERYPDAQAARIGFLKAIKQPLPVEDTAIRESFLQAATFVGRETELGLLTKALDQANQGKGSAWLVGGESGVGKSRLLDELRTQALVSGARVLRGQAVEGSGLPYQLWRDALRRAVLFTELSDLEARVIKPLVPDLDTLLERKILEAPKMEGQAAQKRLVLTMAEIFRRLTEPGGALILILEDLHWSTEGLAPIKAINRLVTENSILVIGSYRSEESPDLPDKLPGMTKLELPRLSTENIAELSTSILGKAGAQPKVLDLLQKETEGNTFFLVETVRALAEEAGRLDHVGEMILPKEVFAGGVQHLLQRRLAHIPEENIPLLKQAAIVGRALDLNLLDFLRSSTVSKEINGIEAWLTTCANLAVLEVQEGQWRFSHDKLRTEILDQMAKTERPIYHRQVANAYEIVYPDNPGYAANLTNHWENAGDRNKTIHYARIAANYAVEQFANEDAISFYTKALTLIPDEDTTSHFDLLLAREGIYTRLGQRYDQETDLEQLQLLAHTQVQKIEAALRHGAFHNNLGEYDAAIEYAKQASLWAIEINDCRKQAQALIIMAQAFQRHSKYEPAANHYRQAHDLAQLSSDQPQIAQTLSGIGEISFQQGDFATATHHHKQALEIYRKMDDLIGQMGSLHSLGQIANEKGEYENAREQYLEAFKFAQIIGDLPNQGRLLLDLAICDWRQSKYPSAETYLQESLALAQSTGDQLTAATVLKNLGNVAYLQGKFAQAIIFFEQSLTIYQEIGNRDGESATLSNLGLAAMNQGWYDKALAYMEQGLEISQEIGDQAGQSRTVNNLGLVAWRQGQFKKAANYYKQGLAIAKEIGDRPAEGKALANLGLVARDQGQYGKAQDYIEQSSAILKEIGDRSGLAKTLNNLGNLAQSRGHFSHAQDYYKRGMTIFVEIGDRDMQGITLNNLGALAIDRSDTEQAITYLQQALTIHEELGQLRYLIDDWAGLALIAMQQGQLQLAKEYLDKVLLAWADVPDFEGNIHPMRAYHFTWQVCQALGLAKTDEILAAAAQVIQTFLDNHQVAQAQEAYLKQPHHQALWQAWRES